MTVTKQEIAARIARLQQKCLEQHIDACLITQNVDVYYFTGSMQTGYLLIPSVGEPVYFVRRSLLRAVQESHVRVEPLGSFRQFGETLAAHFPHVFASTRHSSCARCSPTEFTSRPVLATEFDVLPVQLYRRFVELLPPSTHWVDGSMLVRETRMIKSAHEVAAIRRAAQLADAALEDAAGYVRAGMSELALMARIEYQFRMQGHSGIMRMRGYNQEVITGMVGAGDAAAEPTYFDGPAGGRGLNAAMPQSASMRPIQVGEPILVDIGCNIDGYVIDQTRTLCIGELDAELQRAYDVSESIMRATERQLKPGTIAESLYFLALEIAKEQGLASHFMGYGQDQVTFLGHGIGLEVDELPVLARGFKCPLMPGMVIAIEPKFTFPGRGVVGIENTYLITEDGFEQLTISREGVIQVRG